MALLVSTFILASVISYFSIKSNVVDSYKERLKEGINLVELQFRTHENTELFIKNLHKTSKMRVTLIADDGEVILETNTAKEKMENHASRPEIVEAKERDFGSNIRLSHTINVDLLYMAKHVTIDKNNFYIRFSVSLDKIEGNFYYIWKMMLFAYIFFIVVSLAISYIISKKIRYEIEQINKYLLEISNNNYKAVIKTKYFSEFLQISLLLKNLVKKLHNRDRQKRKHTAKLKLINKQRNDILSAISHEFKNPVAAINGYAETLRDDPEINEKLRYRFLQKIISNGNKITQMIDKLSLSVKLENNDLIVERTKFNMTRLIQEVIYNLEKKYKDRHINFEAVDCTLYADKTMIEMVLINLCDNALKYSQEDVHIVLNNSTLSVVDNGIGIRDKEFKKITSKFYRVDKNTWDNSMGIGLAIVSFILNLHDTKLDIESELNHGSKFSFNLKQLIKK